MATKKSVSKKKNRAKRAAKKSLKPPSLSRHLGNEASPSDYQMSGDDDTPDYPGKKR